METYWTLAGFENLYLEDSWVLSIRPVESTLTFEADLVLTESHPLYHDPRAGEQYCYRRGIIEFAHVTELTWTGGGRPPATDATGEQDLGSFDQFQVEDGRYVISGDFGRIQLAAGPPTVEFVE
jgi:hypothetical protein